jgi:hypothetical protein
MSGMQDNVEKPGSKIPNHTVIACGNAAGNCISPFLIFQGSKVIPDWKDSNTMMEEDTGYASTSSGSMTSVIFMKWLKEHFLMRVDRGHPILVLHNGYSCYVTPSVVKAAEEEGVTLFVLPPPVSRARLPPSDLDFVNPFMKVYDGIVFGFLNDKDATVTEGDISAIVNTAYSAGLGSSDLTKAFEAFGIYPFNPKRYLISY